MCIHIGLSPRVRGNPLYRRRRNPSSGSIPACAGEPSPSSASILLFKVYPRVCGGTPSGELKPPSEQGLSPRVRGNPISQHVLHACIGSIPACAGEPSSIW